MSTVSRLRASWNKNVATSATPPRRANVPARPQRVAELFGEAANRGIVLRAARIEERLAEPYRIELRCETDVDGIELGELLGTGLAVRVATPRGTVRWFHGLIAEASFVASNARASTAELVLRPDFWFLDADQDCRIFQKSSAVDIVREVCSERGIGLSIDSLTGQYASREYCVQYRESTFAFLSRLLEEEGIYYRFRHGPRRNQLELFDDAASHRPEQDYETVILRPTREDLTGIEHAWDLRSRRTFRASDFACTDYDFESPTKSLLARKRAVSPEVGGVEVFDYPGRYIQQDQGEEVARVRLQQLRSEAATLSFRTDARGIRAGSILKLEPEDSDGFATEAMVVRTGFRIVNDPGESSDDIELAGESFVCVADAVRSTDQFRPTLAHQKILVEGPQTAEVVGPSGEEIYTDKHGRVKVQFHWDRRGERDHRSSCWIRVSEPWAGKGWGGLQVPRIGQEVIVDFLEGDPDRPIVTGRVYNGANKPPVDLPGGKMISGMRSKTYKGRGSNEITFDDTDGSQRMFINAQYDQVANTNNNRTTTVGIDSTESIGNDTSLDVGNNSLEVVGVDKTVNVGSNTTVSSGSNIVLEAGTSITLRCGASTISMNQAGFITISGTVVTVAGAANCNMTAPLTNVSGGLLMCSGLINMTSGAIMQVNGSATTVRGGPLNLNP